MRKQNITHNKQINKTTSTHVCSFLNSKPSLVVQTHLKMKDQPKNVSKSTLKKLKTLKLN